MYFGGNQFTVRQSGAKILRALSSVGVNLIMFDHRGYGESTGTPSVENLRQDAIDNYDFARKLIQGKLIVHGQSLGSFEAGAVASVRSLDGLVLESSATNVEEWANVLVPWYARLFVRLNISSELK
ncbi:MAG: alpha/beta hydrolase, partial [Phototrophicales bacterium]